jgi:hypothetical protein
MATDPLIELIRGTDILNLNDLDTYLRIEEDGLGLPDVRRMTERGPYQHGDTDLDFRLEPRIINLVCGVFGGDVARYWAVRRALQRLLRPSGVPLALRYTLPTGDIRQIDVVYAGGLTWSSEDRLITAHRAGFQLRAADPTFYDPAIISTRYGVGGGGGTWAIPWAIPWQIGSATVNQTQGVTTPGDWESYPIIVVIGPIHNLVITNDATGETLDFTGYNVSAGSTLTIDTRYGIKSVLDNTGASQIHRLSDASDLATFHLVAHPDTDQGINPIRVTGSNATSATEIYVQFQARFSAL